MTKQLKCEAPKRNNSKGNGGREHSRVRTACVELIAVLHGDSPKGVEILVQVRSLNRSQPPRDHSNRAMLLRTPQTTTHSRVHQKGTPGEQGTAVTPPLPGARKEDLHELMHTVAK